MAFEWQLYVSPTDLDLSKTSSTHKAQAHCRASLSRNHQALAGTSCSDLGFHPSFLIIHQLHISRTLLHSNCYPRSSSSRPRTLSHILWQPRANPFPAAVHLSRAAFIKSPRRICFDSSSYPTLASQLEPRWSIIVLGTESRPRDCIDRACKTLQRFKATRRP